MIRKEERRGRKKGRPSMFFSLERGIRGVASSTEGEREKRRRRNIKILSRKRGKKIKRYTKGAGVSYGKRKESTTKKEGRLGCPRKWLRKEDMIHRSRVGGRERCSNGS